MAAEQLPRDAPPVVHCDSSGNPYEGLHGAAAGGNAAAVLDMCLAGADVNALHPVRLVTPLWCAVARSRSPKPHPSPDDVGIVVETLLRFGAAASMERRMAGRRTALMGAARRGYTRAMRALLLAGASVSNYVDLSCSPLVVAEARHRRQCVLDLLAMGAPPAQLQRYYFNCDASLEALWTAKNSAFYSIAPTLRLVAFASRLPPVAHMAAWMGEALPDARRAPPPKAVLHLTPGQRHDMEHDPALSPSRLGVWDTPAGASLATALSRAGQGRARSLAGRDPGGLLAAMHLERFLALRQHHAAALPARAMAATLWRTLPAQWHHLAAMHPAMPRVLRDAHWQLRRKLLLQRRCRRAAARAARAAARARK